MPGISERLLTAIGPCMAPLTNLETGRLASMAIRLTVVDWLCFVLLIAGAINWGLIGLVDINAVEAILDPVFQEGALELIARVIYVLVGLAGVYVLYPLYRFSRQTRNTGTAPLTD